MDNLDFSTPNAEEKGIVKDIIKKALPVVLPIIKATICS